MWQVLKNAKFFQLGALNSKLHLFSCWNAGEWAGKEWTGPKCNRHQLRGIEGKSLLPCIKLELVIYNYIYNYKPRV